MPTVRVKLDIEPREQTFLALDPGLRTCGLALFRKGKLAAAGLARNPYGTRSGVRDVEPWIAMAMSTRKWLNEIDIRFIESVIYEMPEVYGGGGSRNSDPNDLMQLAGVLGAVGHALNEAKWYGFFPKDWKGQVSKEVHHRRIYHKYLTGQEQIRLDLTLAANCPEAPSLHHNAYDAVGLGLYVLGRDRPLKHQDSLFGSG